MSVGTFEREIEACPQEDGQAPGQGPYKLTPLQVCEIDSILGPLSVPLYDGLADQKLKLAEKERWSHDDLADSPPQAKWISLPLFQRGQSELRESKADTGTEVTPSTNPGSRKHQEGVFGFDDFRQEPSGFGQMALQQGCCEMEEELDCSEDSSEAS